MSQYLGIIVCLMTLNLAGCGYSHGHLYRDDVGSVRVPIFKNKTFTRGVEFGLTEAVIKELMGQTPYRVTSGQQADTLLEVTIVRAKAINRSRNDLGLSEAVAVSLVIDLVWRDLRNGQVLVERKGLTRESEFLVSRRGGERYQTGEHATVQKLAVDIVSQLRKW